MGVRRPGVFALWAATFLSLTSAQSTTLGVSTTYVPTATWRPNAVCTQGSSYGGPAPYGGVYQDFYGAFWEVQCGYGWSSTNYMDGGAIAAPIGTYGQGIATCFMGCDSRIGQYPLFNVFLSQTIYSRFKYRLLRLHIYRDSRCYYP